MFDARGVNERNRERKRGGKEGGKEEDRGKRDGESGNGALRKREIHKFPRRGKT